MKRRRNSRASGVVHVASSRDVVDGTEYFIVQFQRPDGPLWRSERIHSPDAADTAARVLAAYERAQVVRNG
jgi:hypothetical protein